MKRFWRNVTVAPQADGHRLALDGRPVLTPGRMPLVLPGPALADAVADEWRAVGETIDPRAMPLTGLANAAIERIAANRAGFAAELARYAASDLTCYRATDPPALRERQDARWDPLLGWARQRYDIHFTIIDGVMPRPQPEATVTRLAEAVASLDPWRLAGLSPVVTVAGSLIVALALLDGAIDAEAAWAAADLDDAWQAERWGEDELAVQARSQRRRDLEAGAHLLALLRADETTAPAR